MDETDRLAAAAFRALGVVQLPTIEPRMMAAVTGTGEFQAAHDAVSRLARAQLAGDTVTRARAELHFGRAWHWAKARLRQAEAIAAGAIDPENRVLEALIQSVT